MSDFQEKALRFLEDKGKVNALYFAKNMWPDSDGYNRAIGCGNGVHRGRGMALAAGSYLGKLIKKRLVRICSFNPNQYEITDKGLDILQSNKS